MSGRAYNQDLRCTQLRCIIIFIYSFAGRMCQWLLVLFSLLSTHTLCCGHVLSYGNCRGKISYNYCVEALKCHIACSLIYSNCAHVTRYTCKMCAKNTQNVSKIYTQRYPSSLTLSIWETGTVDVWWQESLTGGGGREAILKLVLWLIVVALTSQKDSLLQ